MGPSARCDLACEAVPPRWNQCDALESERFDNAPAAAWAWAVNSPFRGAKQDAAHLGGTTAPMVISWPGRIRGGGGQCSQFHHVVDIAPTLFELAGIEAPAVVDGVEQAPLEGTSLVYTFDGPEEASRHRVQYFGLFGSRGIYADGWWAGSPKGSPWGRTFGAPSPPPEERAWEVYHLDEDFSQAHDLARQNPEKLEELKRLSTPRRGQPGVPAGTRLRASAVSDNGPYAIRPPPRQQTHTGQGGYTLYLEEGRVTYETNAYGQLSGSLVSAQALGPGRRTVVVEVTPAGGDQGGPPGVRRSIPMMARLIVDGEVIGESKVLMASSGDTLDIGSDLVSPVSPKYARPFAFTGKIGSVTIDLL